MKTIINPPGLRGLKELELQDDGYDAKCLNCRKDAVPLTKRIQIMEGENLPYVYGFEHFAMCGDCTRKFLNSEIRPANETEWLLGRKHLVRG